MTDKEKINILLVDDKPANLLALESLLEQPGVGIIKATSGNEALGVLLEHDVALVLMDVQMPDMDGFETAELMRCNERTRSIPIIFVTAISKEQQHIFKGYETGAVDYLFKPVDPHILTSKVRVFLELHRQQVQIEKTNHKLEAVIERLQQSNKKILDQQRAVIEEERLKVLLQMAGATAHELNQPLTGLLGSVELLQMEQDNPEKVKTHIARIDAAGKRISEIVKKIQNLHQVDTQLAAAGADISMVNRPLIKILSVEDSDVEFKDIKTLVAASSNILLKRSTTLEDTLKLMKTDPVDIALVNYFLPDGTGLDLMRKMEAGAIDTPVIIITGKGDEMIAAQVIQAGAYDYLPKDQLNEKNLFQAISSTLTKSQLKHEARIAIRKMAEMSVRDVLTGLYNRRYFFEALDREISRAGRTHSDIVLCMMDLDHFKRINDTMGHPAGDMVLSEFGRMLKDWIRQSDIACRYGGEEFTILLADTDVQKATGVCDRLRNTLSQRIFTYNQTPFQITVSMGIASLTSLTHKTGENLIQAADDALYQAKNQGRNILVVYRPDSR